MANNWCELGLEGFADGSIDYDTHQFKAYLCDLNDCGAAAGGWIASTHDNAATVTITTTANHGLAAGDRVTLSGFVSGGTARGNSTAYALGAIFTSGGGAFRVVKAGTSAGSAPTFNTSAVGDVTQDGTAAVQYMGTQASIGSILNYGEWDSRGFAKGYWTVNTAPTGTTFTIVLPNAPGTYTSGGRLINLSKRFVSDMVPSGGRVALSPALAGKTLTKGVLVCSQISFTGVSGDQSEFVLIAKTANAAGADDADTAQRCVLVYDSLTLLPVTPNGGDINWTPSPNLATL